MISIISALISSIVSSNTPIVGAYYFGGWAGENANFSKGLKIDYKAPTHLTERMVEDFPGLEPVWGWRDDTRQIMDRQIELASRNGVDFFIFDWYWRVSGSEYDSMKTQGDPRHSAMSLFRNAAANKMKYAILVANHRGAEIVGTKNWIKAVQVWSELFHDSNYIKVDGKPLVVIFDPQVLDDSMIKVIQGEAQRLGFPGIYLGGCGGGGIAKSFSFATQYAVVKHYSGDCQNPRDYSEITQTAKYDREKHRTMAFIPSVSSGTDRRPWSDGLVGKQGCTLYFKRDPVGFETALKESIDWMIKNPNLTSPNKLLFIYAWNELGEGGYLVPTKADPNASVLHRIPDVLRQYGWKSPEGKIGKSKN